MGFTRKVIRNGNGVDKPKSGDTVLIAYVGNLYDESVPSADDHRGAEFDSSRDRGDFKTKIGVGAVIRGWDEGVLEMSLGEKSILTITSDFAYGDRGFYDLIPANSSLVFEVELKGINDKMAA